MENRLPNYFKTYRKRHGLGQKQMAELLDKSRFHILRLESGQSHPSLYTAIALSILFDVEISDLMPELHQKLQNLLKDRL